MTTIFLTKIERQNLIDEYMDCYIETGNPTDEEADDMRYNLNCMSNSELYNECKASGWDIL